MKKARVRNLQVSINMHEYIYIKVKGDIELGAENKFLLLEKTANIYAQLITHVFISFLSTFNFNFSFHFPYFALKYPFTAYVHCLSNSAAEAPTRQRLDILC
jgi:hypothetical protein